MSMSTHIVGFRPADESWNNMKEIWEACTKAKVKIPDDVMKFFDGEAPGDKPGCEISIKKAVADWGDDYRSGYELDISKLPEGVSKIRFYNSC